MYQRHFKFTGQPFSEHAPAATLWRDVRMEEGLARLEHLVEHATVGLVTGASGVGKSALLRRFLHELSRPRCEAIYCHLTHLPATGMLKMLVTQLGEVPRYGKGRLFEQILQRAARSDGTLVLVLDEAHLLDSDALTDLRLLVSSAIDTAPPRYQLRPLSKDQTASYIDFQITQAGGSEKVFDHSVKVAIHDFTGGVPRQINNLATACLLQATARNVLRIDEELFGQAVAEFQFP
jgi:general secretion pathway protein A